MVRWLGRFLKNEHKVLRQRRAYAKGKKYHLQGSEDVPSGRNGGHVGRLHGKGGLGTAGELFKNWRRGVA